VDEIALNSKKTQREDVPLVFFCDFLRGGAPADALDDGSHDLSSLYQLLRTVHVVCRGICYWRVVMGFAGVGN
jgi:hypothetical protein